MRVSIVGHGVSLTGAKKGNEIDSFDKVVRLKGSNTVLGSDDFGFKVDALVASTEIMGTFFKMDSPEYWAYPKKGDFDAYKVMHSIVGLQKPVLLALSLCNTWNSRFRQLSMNLHNEIVHPNFSTGMAAIVIACHRWNPDEIKLFGFDTLTNPKIPFVRHAGIPRSGIGAIPNHDWETEHELLKTIEKTYNCKITYDPYEFPTRQK